MLFDKIIQSYLNEADEKVSKDEKTKDEKVKKEEQAPDESVEQTDETPDDEPVPTADDSEGGDDNEPVPTNDDTDMGGEEPSDDTTDAPDDGTDDGGLGDGTDSTDDTSTDDGGLGDGADNTDEEGEEDSETADEMGGLGSTEDNIEAEPKPDPLDKQKIIYLSKQYLVLKDAQQDLINMISKITNDNKEVYGLLYFCTEQLELNRDFLNDYIVNIFPKKSFEENLLQYEFFTVPFKFASKIIKKLNDLRNNNQTNN